LIEKLDTDMNDSLHHVHGTQQIISTNHYQEIFQELAALWSTW
jgi:hypothetical protein